jgi:hypothetical protein
MKTKLLRKVRKRFEIVKYAQHGRFKNITYYLIDNKVTLGMFMNEATGGDSVEKQSKTYLCGPDNKLAIKKGQEKILEILRKEYPTLSKYNRGPRKTITKVWYNENVN